MDNKEFAKKLEKQIDQEVNLISRIKLKFTECAELLGIFTSIGNKLSK